MADTDLAGDGYSDRCSRTNRTARSRKAESIFFGTTHILTTRKDATSNLGRFRLRPGTDHAVADRCPSEEADTRNVGRHQRAAVRDPHLITAGAAERSDSKTGILAGAILTGGIDDGATLNSVRRVAAR